MNKIEIGDHVKYSREFLRSSGEYTGPMPFAKGTVVEVHAEFTNGRILKVDWNDPQIPDKVLEYNLIKVGDIEHV